MNTIMRDITKMVKKEIENRIEVFFYLLCLNWYNSIYNINTKSEEMKKMKIGIITAMPIELEYILEKVTIIEKRKMKRNTFYVAKYMGNDLIMVTSGVSKTNAVAYTQLLIDYFDPDCLFNLGIAGGLQSGLKPSDIVIGEFYSHHDVKVNQMEELFPFISKFDTNKLLLDFVSENMPQAIKGGIVSGERFVDSTEQKEQIITTFGAAAVDMESSAIAHACYINELPFMAIRGISDLADDGAKDTYDFNEKKASDQVGRAFLEMISEKEMKKKLL